MREVKKPEVRRAEIMDMSTKLFVEKGYLNTTTQDIISALGISRGLLYYHFKSKEDILFCIAEQQTAPLFKKIDGVMADESLGAVEKIRNFFKATFTDPSDGNMSQEEVQVLETLQDAIQLPENSYMIDSINHRIVYRISKQFAEILEQGISEDVFHVGYPEETASFIMTAFTFVMNDPFYHNNNISKTMKYYLAFADLVNKTLNAKEPILKNDFQ